MGLSAVHESPAWLEYGYGWLESLGEGFDILVTCHTPDHLHKGCREPFGLFCPKCLIGTCPILFCLWALPQHLLPHHHRVSPPSYPRWSTVFLLGLDALAWLPFIHPACTHVPRDHSLSGTCWAFLPLCKNHLLQSLRLVKKLVQSHITRNGQRKDTKPNWSCEPPRGPSSEVYCIYVGSTFLSHSWSFLSSFSQFPERQGKLKIKWNKVPYTSGYILKDKIWHVLISVLIST